MAAKGLADADPVELPNLAAAAAPPKAPAAANPGVMPKLKVGAAVGFVAVLVEENDEKPLDENAEVFSAVGDLGAPNGEPETAPKGEVVDLEALGDLGTPNENPEPEAAANGDVVDFSALGDLETPNVMPDDTPNGDSVDFSEVGDFGTPKENPEPAAAKGDEVVFLSAVGDFGAPKLKPEGGAVPNGDVVDLFALGDLASPKEKLGAAPKGEGADLVVIVVVVSFEVLDPSAKGEAVTNTPEDAAGEAAETPKLNGDFETSLESEAGVENENPGADDCAGAEVEVGTGVVVAGLAKMLPDDAGSEVGAVEAGVPNANVEVVVVLASDFPNEKGAGFEASVVLSLATEGTPKLKGLAMVEVAEGVFSATVVLATLSIVFSTLSVAFSSSAFEPLPTISNSFWAIDDTLGAAAALASLVTALAVAAAAARVGCAVKEADAVAGLLVDDFLWCRGSLSSSSSESMPDVVTVRLRADAPLVVCLEASSFLSRPQISAFFSFINRLSSILRLFRASGASVPFHSNRRFTLTWLGRSSQSTPSYFLISRYSSNGGSGGRCAVSAVSS